MASSKVMTSSSPSNQDLPTQNSSSSLHIHSDCSRGYGSAIMDDLFESMYSDSDSFVPEKNPGNGTGCGDRAEDEVWRDVVSGGLGDGEAAMTLEVFLVKAGLGNGDDVRVSETVAMPSPTMDAEMIHQVNATGVPAVQFTRMAILQNAMAPGRFGTEFVDRSGGGSGTRGKRRAAVEEVALDKISQQKQRRMIKNRESAARSRERKQAYTEELESLVTQLEEENVRLLEEEAKLRKERYKQLMENLIPVVDKGRPPRVLRRVLSMNW